MRVTDLGLLVLVVTESSFRCFFVSVTHIFGFSQARISHFITTRTRKTNQQSRIDQFAIPRTQFIIGVLI